MRPPRIAGFTYEGFHRYFLTLCTRQRRRLFENGATVSIARAEFLRTAVDEQFEVLAYCFMPDHLHLLVQGRSPGADLRRFVKIGKARAAHALATAGVRDAWQAGYYDRVLRDDEDTPDVTRYIFDNPVRAGLVAFPGDYPFSGSALGNIGKLL